MKQVFIDASSAILLHKSALFDTMTAAYALGMVHSVLMEVTHPGRPGCDEFRRCQRLQQLTIVHFDRDDNVDQALSAMGRGERDTIVAGRMRKASFIVLDDRKGARYCRLHAIPYANALLCARLLFLGGIIAPDVYARGFNRLMAVGRYTPAILDFALNATRDSLSQFLP
jgi:hypothetical protein